MFEKCYFLILIVLFSLHPIVAVVGPLTIDTLYGKVLGVSNSNLNYRAWYNIPYAAPPVGDLRWREPQAPLNWTLKDCKSPTPYKACPQKAPPSINANLTEDCLYLNVFAPYNDSITPLPVMFWIHGGGFINGTGASYPGINFVSKANVIFVSMNYRLGVFGFFGNHELMDEDPYNRTGSYGLLDQIFALNWVIDNIEFFGGEPDNITIIGEGAGGSSVIFLLSSPVARGLFSAAIIESGVPQHIQHLNTTIEQSLNITTLTSCGSGANISCLRNLSFSDLNNAYDTINTCITGCYIPAIDGVTLTDYPLNVAKDGNVTEVPIFAGTNENEWSYFMCRSILSKGKNESTFSVYDYQSTLASYGYNASLVMDTYPASSFFYKNPYSAIVEFGSDMRFKCSIRLFLDYINQNSSQPIYMYSFDYRGGFPSPCSGVQHTYELFYLFPNLQSSWSPYHASRADNVTTSLMTQVWTSFVIHKVPWISWNQHWPLYVNESFGTYGIFNNASGFVTLNNRFRSSFCPYWDYSKYVPVLKKNQ